MSMIHDPINSSDLDEMRDQLDNVAASQNEQSLRSMGNAEGDIHPAASQGENVIKSVPTDDTNNIHTSKTHSK